MFCRHLRRVSRAKCCCGRQARRAEACLGNLRFPSGDDRLSLRQPMSVRSHFVIVYESAFPASDQLEEEEFGGQGIMNVGGAVPLQFRPSGRLAFPRTSAECAPFRRCWVLQDATICLNAAWRDLPRKERRVKCVGARRRRRKKTGTLDDSTHGVQARPRRGPALPPRISAHVTRLLAVVPRISFALRASPRRSVDAKVWGRAEDRI